MKRNTVVLIALVGVIEVAVALFWVAHFFSARMNEVQDTSASSIPVLQTTPSHEGPYPSQVLNLTSWKLTLPIGTVKKPTRPSEILQPELAAYKIDPWFTLTSDGKGVVFRAPVVGLTTGGTNYARSELREMIENGKKRASWSSTEGKHTMFLDQAIQAVPKGKPHVVAGQIHDDSDDVLVIRLEYPQLYVNVDGENVATLDANYTLGKRFTVLFEVSEGQTKVYYNGSSAPSYTLKKDYEKAYFKAGVYTQSNCDREAKDALCTADNYGQIALYQLRVGHED